MRVLFRADASIARGSGHIMRCLTLAKALQQRGAVCDFACRVESGHLIAWLQQQGFNVISLISEPLNEEHESQLLLAALQHDYRLLIVDHYQLTATFCQLLRQRCQYVMVIDDLANRALDCELLLDQNLLPDQHLRYQGLIPAHCRTLLGPKFALLRDEFYSASATPLANHLLISFGGSDADNLTSMAINALVMLKPRGITADIVIGANNPWRAMLQRQLANLPDVQLHIQTTSMATLMRKARLMLGAGGTTHWERSICGLPGLVVTVAENQQATTAYLNKLGACVWLGQAAEMSAEFFAEQLCYYLSQPALLDEIGRRAKNLVPDNAGTPLVVEQILNVVANR
ncbi:FlaR protein (FlaR) [Alishewanella aestuarii B11]|uniref:FlaR protein (FlaR) n=1 Tax=Alishewanella aestuarii B11 TaxID=1197174 RepID=J2IBS9_9ALTE|nr:UDP-2,4-diacetamido-2,4,6-trideoxy-beta-L-altropyranose hydrolase [Alishewanella aestuarii]EJI84119.1 FlaR protein (FlaR) [Alishewanella aestuarii B11]